MPSTMVAERWVYVSHYSGFLAQQILRIVGS